MRIAVSLWVLLQVAVCQGGWKTVPADNPDGPGNVLDIRDSDRLVARFVLGGEGQIKPYLHVFGEHGEVVTNAGADKNGKSTGAFPHHRGIFIGWKVESELGTDDLWHMTKGCKMEVMEVVLPVPVATNGNDSTRIVATILWKSAKSTNGSDLLITERRDLTFSRRDKQTQVDATFALMPARNVRLAGDLQHSGVHFRASNEVHGRQSETSYLSSPEGKNKGNDLKWCRLSFPIGTNVYSALQLNHPANPVEELSTRKYGRFGYFFKKDLTKGKPLTLKYRFLIGKEPASVSGRADTLASEADAAYAAFAK